MGSKITEPLKRTYTQKRIQYQIANYFLEHNNILPCCVLDVGAGTGEYSDILSSKGYRVSCVDGFTSYYNILKEKHKNTYKIDLEEERLPFKNSTFDLVVSLEVIEHLWNTENYLNEIRRVLKPKGYFICTTPNYNFIKFRMIHLIGHHEKYTFNSRHKKFYTTFSFKKELVESFEILEYVGNLPKNPLINLIKNESIMNLISYDLGMLVQNKK